MRSKQFRLLLVILSITLLLSFNMSMVSCSHITGEYRFEDFRYTVENGQVTIIRYWGLKNDVVIPEYIRDMPVVKIDIDAFGDCHHVKSVVIPDTVTTIDIFAFDNCHALERVVLGNGIRVIDTLAFSDCDSLIYNEYENGNYLGNDENPYVALKSMKAQGVETVTIHPDTRVVCGSALEGCGLLKEISFPEGVLSICYDALDYCKNLEKVYIPKSVEKIYSTSFDGCSSLREINVSEENPHYKSIDGNLFSRDGTTLVKYAVATPVEVYRLPDGVVNISSYAFMNAMNLVEVTLPDSVENIYTWAFDCCENLKNIDLGNGLKYIDSCVFSSCISLTSITIPDSVTEISYSVFYGCTSLETAVIGKGVSRIDRGIFGNCTALKEVVFLDPTGWSVSAAYSLSSDKVDLSNPQHNAKLMIDDYERYYWSKK